MLPPCVGRHAVGVSQFGVTEQLLPRVPVGAQDEGCSGWRCEDPVAVQRGSMHSFAMRARLLTASSFVHVNSQPFVRHPVTGWTSPVALGGPRAGISTGRVSCRAAGYAERAPDGLCCCCSGAVLGFELLGITSDLEGLLRRCTTQVAPCGPAQVRPRSPSRVRLRCKQGMGPRNFLAFGGQPTR